VVDVPVVAVPHVVPSPDDRERRSSDNERRYVFAVAWTRLWVARLRLHGVSPDVSTRGHPRQREVPKGHLCGTRAVLSSLERLRYDSFAKNGLTSSSRA